MQGLLASVDRRDSIWGFEPETLNLLRQDRLVWKAVDQPGIIGKLIEKNASWLNPAGVFCLMAGLPLQQIKDGGVNLLDIDQVHDVVSGFSQRLVSQTAPENLEEAGWLAIGLREHWGDGELVDMDQLAFDRWRTVIACALGLMKDAKRVLGELMHYQEPGIKCCIHAVLTNYRTMDEQRKIFLDLLQDLPGEEQIACLKGIGDQGRDSLQKKLAEDLIEYQDLQSDRLEGDLENPDILMPENTIWQHQRNAQLLVMAGKNGEALKNLAVAENQLRYRMAITNLLRADAGKGDTSDEARRLAAQRAIKLAPEVPLIHNQALLLLEKQDWTLADVENHRESPILQIRMAASVFQRGHIDECRTVARDAVTKWLEQLDVDHSPLLIHKDFENQAMLDLLKLGLTAEAVQLFERKIWANPNHCGLLETGNEIYKACLDFDAALQICEVLTGLQPENLQYRRELAANYEKKGDWASALQQWGWVCAAQTATRDDRLRHAQCASWGGHPQVTISECKLLIEMDPDSGLAHALLGEALVKLEHLDEGMKHLGLATLLTPEEPRSWIKLAEAHQHNGDLGRAVETLGAAVTATAGDGRIHLCFGKLLDQLDRQTEALEHFERAYQALPGEVEAGHLLARSLENLGYRQQAKGILYDCKKLGVFTPEMSALEGKIHLCEKAYDQAYAAYEQAVALPNAPVEWTLGYIDSLLEMDDNLVAGRLEKATEKNSKILDVNPDNLHARLNWARILFQDGQEEPAFSILSTLMEAPEYAESDLSSPIKRAYAKSAWKLGLLDTAIATYRELLDNKTDVFEVRKELALVYRDSGNYEACLKTAQEILVENGHEPRFMHWYARLARQCGKFELCRDALKKTLDLDPQYWPAWFDLADMEIDEGNITEAEKKASLYYQSQSHTPSDLWRASVTFDRLRNHRQAMDCLDRIAKQAQPSTRLWIQKAMIAEKNGACESASSMLYTALQDNPNNPAILAYLADLMAVMNKPQTAIQLFEQSIKQLDNDVDVPADPWEDGDITAFIPDDWFQKMAEPAHLYLRMTLVSLQTGNLEEALKNAEIALSIAPENLEARLLCIDLATILMMGEKARTWMEAINWEEIKDLSPEAGYAAGCLAALTAEDALRRGCLDEALQQIRRGLSVYQDFSRLQACHVRCLAEQGEYAMAGRLFEDMVCALEHEREGSQTASMRWYERTLRHQMIETYPVWVGEALFSLGRWSEAIHLLESRTDGSLNPVNQQVLYIEKALTCAALEDTYQEVHVLKRTPQDIQSPERHHKILDAINFLARQKRGFQPLGWIGLANAVYNPSPHNLRELQAVGVTANQAGILAACWRKAGNPAEVKRLAEMYPLSVDVQIQLALAFADQDVEVSQAALSRAANLQPHFPLIHAVSAKIEETSGNDINALMGINQAITTWPDVASWHAWAAQVHERCGDLEKSQASWEQAIATNPAEVEYLRQGMAVSLKLNDAARVIEYGVQATRLDPKNYACWMLMAEANMAAGQHQDALDCAQIASDINKENIAPRLLSAKMALKTHNYDQAAHLTQAALMIDPENGEALQLMADVYLAQNRPEIALDLLEARQPVSRDTVSLGLTRAKLIQKVKGGKEAILVYRELSKIHAQSPEIWAELAQAEAANHNLDAAIVAANHAIRLKPMQPVLMNLMGKLCLQAGHLDKAIYYLTEAVKQNPLNMDAYLDLGKALVQQRQFTEAMRVYSQAMQAAPEDFRPYYDAALAQRDNKDYLHAEKLLRKAVNCAPENIAIRRQLAAMIALNMVYHAQEEAV